MKRSVFFFAMAAIMLALASCNKKGTGLLTPASSGRPYEVMVVMDDSTWNQPAGRALFGALDTDVPGLPQSERSFFISHTNPDGFDRITKLCRNIIIADVNPQKYTQTKFKYARDIYAKPQLILTIQSPNGADFAEYVKKNAQVIVDFFTLAEMNREVQYLKKHHNKKVTEKVREMFDCEVDIPEDLLYTKEGTNFLWVSTRKSTADMNFVMYSYPYTSDKTFTEKYFVAKRDSFMKANIPGAQPNMYMATDTMLLSTRTIQVKHNYTMEVRGLWEMENDMMGGPFVSHACVDTVHNRVIVVEGFVYSPDRLKRNIMRKMEASLYTLKLPGDKVDAIDMPSNVEEDKGVKTTK